MSAETNESLNSGSFFTRVKTVIEQNEQHIREGSSYFFAIGILFALIPMMFFVLFYYFLFYIDIFTR